MTDLTLKDRVAIITGAGTVGTGVGVGKATSVVLAQQGANLVLADIDLDRVKETQALVGEAGAESIVCIGNIVDPSDCEEIVSNAMNAFGTVDVLVNNAAASVPGTVETLGDDDWDLVLGVSLLGAVRMARYTVPVMRAAGRGSIVNISSICSSRGLVTAAYASAKGGLEALTRDMAVAHGREGIRINAIAPGHLNTPRVAAVSQGTEDQNVRTNPELRNAASPLGTEGTAWDVAWAVEYLASDRARWITGVTLPVDGGVLATTYMSMEPIIRRDHLT
jgi:NAD(P)-dependent dehydrogenase (short-subunit alcohol dehydrogenase family)